MSNPLRVAFVAEGPTDFVVLRAAIQTLLGDIDFTPTLISPLVDASLLPLTGGGWTSVYLWCKQMLTDGDARKSELFRHHELLVIQVDADVADKNYSDDKRIVNPPQDLPLNVPCAKPCQIPCPRPCEIADALRSIVLGWLNETEIPPNTIVCVASRSIETWALVALFPEDTTSLMQNVECRRDCEGRLKTHQVKKTIRAYRDNEPAIGAGWPNVRRCCGEAERFSEEFLAWFQKASRL